MSDSSKFDSRSQHIEGLEGGDLVFPNGRHGYVPPVPTNAGSLAGSRKVEKVVSQGSHRHVQTKAQKELRQSRKTARSRDAGSRHYAASGASESTASASSFECLGSASVSSIRGGGDDLADKRTRISDLDNSSDSLKTVMRT